MERRSTNGDVSVETRADGGSKIVGYAAVFFRSDDPGSEYRMAPDLVERISPKAFDAALSGGEDVRALYNHDPSQLLGRSKAGTLRLSTDQRGLKYEIDIADTTTGKDVAASIARGDLSGSSFGFIVKSQKFDRSKDGDIRTLESVSLLDVGPVTYPAYEGTSTALRSGECQDAIEARKAWSTERDAVEVRTRLLTLENDLI